MWEVIAALIALAIGIAVEARFGGLPRREG
jgi:hypothetical protein